MRAWIKRFWEFITAHRFHRWEYRGGHPGGNIYFECGAPYCGRRKFHAPPRGYQPVDWDWVHYRSDILTVGRAYEAD